MAPHASKASSVSSSFQSSTGFADWLRMRGGVDVGLTARVDVFAVRGMDDERKPRPAAPAEVVAARFGASCCWMGWISPFAVVALFVKEDMAQPVHDVGPLGEGDAILAGAASPAVGGMTVSTIVSLKLRIRWR